MKEIINYLVNARNQKPEVAKKIASGFERHADIRDELNRWLMKKDYSVENPVIVSGYSAEQIYKLAPFMDGVGVYNFLITLRERPEVAQRIIAEGFRRK